MTARAQPDRRKWTAAQVRALGVRCSVPQAGEILGGLSATQSYLLAQRGDFPVPILKVGRRLIVPTAPILQLLGLSDHGGRAQPAPLRPVDDPDDDEPLGRSGQRLRILAAPPSAQPAPRTPDAERPRALTRKGRHQVHEQLCHPAGHAGDSPPSAGGNRGRAAQALGVSRSSLYATLARGERLVQVIVVGRRMRVLTHSLIAVLEGQGSQAA